MSIDDTVERHLPRRETNDASEWSIWERKTWNMHRGVLRYRPNRQGIPFSEINDAVREHVARSFQISWWRGFAFGVVVQLQSMPSDVAGVVDSIDGRARSSGCWQWAILACDPLKTAFGVHTWMEVALTPVYRALLEDLRVQGFEIGSFKKEKDDLMKFLTAVAKFKGHGMSEFRT